MNKILIDIIFLCLFFALSMLFYYIGKRNGEKPFNDKKDDFLDMWDYMSFNNYLGHIAFAVLSIFCLVKILLRIFNFDLVC